jgi:hypothetical protein
MSIRIRGALRLILPLLAFSCASRAPLLDTARLEPPVDERGHPADSVLCRSDADCPNPGERCGGFGSCGTARVATSCSAVTCPAGDVCVEVFKPCVQGADAVCFASCSADSCEAGSTCDGQVCRAVSCRQGYPCPAGTLCSATPEFEDDLLAPTHGCTARACQTDSDCPAFCVQGQCAARLARCELPLP